MTSAFLIIFQSILHKWAKIKQHMGCNGQISVKCLQSDLIYQVLTDMDVTLAFTSTGGRSTIIFNLTEAISAFLHLTADLRVLLTKTMIWPCFCWCPYGVFMHYDNHHAQNKHSTSTLRICALDSLGIQSWLLVEMGLNIVEARLSSFSTKKISLFPQQKKRNIVLVI